MIAKAVHDGADDFSAEKVLFAQGLLNPVEMLVDRETGGIYIGLWGLVETLSGRNLPAGRAGGSVQLASPASLGGSVLFSGQLGTAGMTIVEPDTDFLIPVRLDSALGLQTGISLTNPADSPVDVRLRLYDGKGLWFEEKIVSEECPTRHGSAGRMKIQEDLPHAFPGIGISAGSSCPACRRSRPSNSVDL